jgi:hypothetical protein
MRKVINPSPEEVAVLNEKSYYTAYFGLDADEVKKYLQEITGLLLLLKIKRMSRQEQ